MIDIFQNNKFFEISPPRGPQTTEKCASHPRFVNWNRNKYHDYCDIRWFYDPSFVWKRCYNFKRSQSKFLIIFQNHPLKQFYRDYQFCHFSTAKKTLPGTWLSFCKCYSRERAILLLPIYEIKFWGNSNGKFWGLKTLTVLAWNLQHLNLRL